MKCFKRKIAVLLSLSLIFSVAGCSEKKAVKNPNPKMPVSEESVSSDSSHPSEAKAEVVYDSSYEIPEFNYDSGFFNNEFDLTLDISNSELNIHYTLDGSTPTINSESYSAPIHIKDRSGDEKPLTEKDGISPDEFTADNSLPMGTVVRAAAFDKDGVSSPVATNTYFVGIKRSEKYSDAPVISLVTDSENLFDYEKGIYILGKAFDDWSQQNDISRFETWQYQGNFSQKGREWERPVNFELMESDGTVGFEQQLGARIMGTATRTYLQKSFRLYARQEYGDKNINYSLIPGVTKENDDTQKLEKYKNFLLRNGGNDCDYTKLRDPFIQKLVSDRDLTTQGSRPAVVFINGEYWGLYSIQEDYTDNYIQYNYDIDKTDAVIIKCGKLEEGTTEDEALYDELIKLYSADLSDDANYQTVCNVLDIQNSIDYFCTLILTANEDCILNNDNNWRIWRSRSVTDNKYQDGKWRFMLYDTEYSLGLYNDDNFYVDSMQVAMGCKMFSSLMQNKDFVKQFVLSYMDMLNFNFNPDISIPVLDSLSDQYGPLREDCYKRFGPKWVSSYGKTYYEDSIKNIKTFLKRRYEYAPKILKDNLSLRGDTAEITVNLNGKGKVKINSSVPDISKGSFSGIYFTDYPVTLTAICDDGYKFNGWTGGVSEKNETITIPLSDALSVTANFSIK